MTHPDHKTAQRVSLALEPVLDGAASASSPAVYADRLTAIAAALHAEAEAVSELAAEAHQSCKPAKADRKGAKR